MRVTQLPGAHNIEAAKLKSQSGKLVINIRLCAQRNR